MLTLAVSNLRSGMHGVRRTSKSGEKRAPQRDTKQLKQVGNVVRKSWNLIELIEMIDSVGCGQRSTLSI